MREGMSVWISKARGREVSMSASRAETLHSRES